MTMEQHTRAVRKRLEPRREQPVVVNGYRIAADSERCDYVALDGQAESKRDVNLYCLIRWCMEQRR